VGNLVEVAGTVAGTVAVADDGVALGDVVRTRIFVTDISRWEAVGRAHGEAFRDIKPATTMVEVKSLISPEMLVEIEATAVVADPTS
jgi:enamine deaminase RidA (YjgF/YER057c/UK114 family)